MLCSIIGLAFPRKDHCLESLIYKADLTDITVKGLQYSDYRIRN